MSDVNLSAAGGAASSNAPKLVLCILDGVGYRTGPGSEEGNAIAAAKSPFYDSLFERYPYTTLDPCGLAVGLPEGQMGNSEVGHLTIGAGRVVNQELVRISKCIEEDRLGEKEAWNDFIERAVDATGRLHLLGLVSPGGVHSHTDHLLGIVAEAKKAGLKEIYIHAFLDGRDTDPRSGKGYVAELQKKLDEIGAGRITSVCGRYWAMDRDKRWDRVARAWGMMVCGRSDVTATDPVQAIADSYANEITDEFVEPTVIRGDDGEPVATIEENDSVFFWNFRADRARELTWAFLEEDFNGFEPQKRPTVNYLSMTEYDEKLDSPALFVNAPPENGLAEVFQREGIRNLRTAETEKYAHVTYFFNGGREEPYEGESRELISSPKVATYDLQPEMSAPAVAEVVQRACASSEYDVVVVNFANGDMVGHTGIFEAAVSAFETLDRLLSEVMPPSLERGTTWLVTADHGNCDEMLTADGAVLTQHSLNRVPFVLAGEGYEKRTDALAEGDFGLADIAPTILALLGIDQPAEMGGRSMLK